MDAVDPLILAAMLGAAVARARPPVASVARLAVVTFVALGGCGGNSSFRNDPRPPAPIVLSAVIGGDRVSVSPRSFGAGPISLVGTNQTSAPQRVILESVQKPGGGPGLKQRTVPISRRHTTTLKADLKPGSYRVGVVGGGITPARLHVGAERPSAQNVLLQP
jgi:hypothetical protein